MRIPELLTVTARRGLDQGSQLRAWMAVHGLSARQLAEQAGVSRTMISRAMQDRPTRSAALDRWLEEKAGWGQ